MAEAPTDAQPPTPTPAAAPASIGYDVVQRAMLQTDPRGVVVFTAPIKEVLGQVVALAEAFRCPYRILPATSVKPPVGVDSPDVLDIDFLQLLQAEIDSGTWVVLQEASHINSATWRAVGKILFTLAPDDCFHGRAAFRLITFVMEGVDVAAALPPLVYQYAFRVDGLGKITSRSTLVPVFEGNATTMPRLAALKHHFTYDASQAINEDSRQEYMKFLSAVAAAKLPVYQGAKVPATAPEFITDILVTLRDVLAHEQQAMIDDAEKKDRALTRRSRKQLPQEGGGGFGPPPPDGAESDASSSSQGSSTSSLSAALTAAADHSEDDEAALLAAAGGMAVEGPHVKELTQKHDWIYHKMLAWVIDQCPDADISAITTVRRDELVTDSLLRVSGSDVYHTGHWNGCGVLVKSIDPSLSTSPEAVAIRRRQLTVEAARHFPLRHPQILALYGICEGNLVMEHVHSTLEQNLIQARFDNVRWSVKYFYNVAVHILQGMVFLSTCIVHRDLACRSIMMTDAGAYKIADFGNSLPLRHPPGDAMRGTIPVRWTAPEGFAGVFTPKSDMWSLGVLMWSAVQYCTAVPYADVFAPEAIQQGVKLTQPRQCPDELWRVVIEPCFAMNPLQRPSALQHLSFVQSHLRSHSKHFLSRRVPFPTDNCSFVDFAAKEGLLASPAASPKQQPSLLSQSSGEQPQMSGMY